MPDLEENLGIKNFLADNTQPRHSKVHHHFNPIFMKRLSLLITFIIPLSLASQVNWSEDIAPILYDHCKKCYHPEGI